MVNAIQIKEDISDFLKETATMVWEEAKNYIPPSVRLSRDVLIKNLHQQISAVVTDASVQRLGLRDLVKESVSKAALEGGYFYALKTPPINTNLHLNDPDIQMVNSLDPNISPVQRFKSLIQYALKSELVEQIISAKSPKLEDVEETLPHVIAYEYREKVVKGSSNVLSQDFKDGFRVDGVVAIIEAISSLEDHEIGINGSQERNLDRRVLVANVIGLMNSINKLDDKFAFSTDGIARRKVPSYEEYQTAQQQGDGSSDLERLLATAENFIENVALYKNLLSEAEEQVEGKISELGYAISVLSEAVVREKTRMVIS